MRTPPQISTLTAVHIAPDLPGPDSLLLVMHGLGDSLDGFRFLPKVLRIPGLHYLLVNAPDRYFMGYSWFDLSSEIEPGVERSRRLLFTALDELQEQGWPGDQIGVLGFSQGALMAIDLAARYPKPLGPIVAVSGFAAFLSQYPEAFSPVARRQRILVTHGTEDPMLPYKASQQQMHTLQGMGLPLQWKTYNKAHSIDPDQEVTDIRRFLVEGFGRNGK